MTPDLLAQILPLQETTPALFIGAAIAAYLIGCIPFAVVVSKAFGLADPRSFGSGNPGATNVLRSGNKKAAIFTLLFDALKGWLPVFGVVQYGAAFGLGESTAAAAGVAAFLGHLYPVFFRFQGGKGVATALGVLMGVNPLLGLATLCTWLIVAVLFRYSSLAALSASLFAPVYYGFGNQLAWQTSAAQWWAVAIMSALLLWRHRDNISRLVAGQESKIGAKKETSPAEESVS